MGALLVAVTAALLWRQSSFVPTPKLVSSSAAVSRGPARSSQFLRGAASSNAAIYRAIDREARRQGCTAMQAVGVLFATQTGNTEGVAGQIAEAIGVEAEDIGEYGAEDLSGFDGLIVGCPTWNTGADEYRSGTSWDDIIDEIKELSLDGKPVAVFGCGDSEGYGDNFCDGIEELHATFKAAGAKMIGYVDASGYNHEESKSVSGGKFLGLPCDEDNESDQTDDRVGAW